VAVGHLYSHAILGSKLERQIEKAYLRVPVDMNKALGAGRRNAAEMTQIRCDICF
jgi:hypothetical protein